jgi:hypothetical protein
VASTRYPKIDVLLVVIVTFPNLKHPPRNQCLIGDEITYSNPINGRLGYERRMGIMYMYNIHIYMLYNLYNIQYYIYIPYTIYTPYTIYI